MRQCEKNEIRHIPKITVGWQSNKRNTRAEYEIY